MAAKDPAALKRLGGGRWQTRDERFTIEPQGGSWVVVDAEQTDELGLPLVRGPFGSLTDARAAIEAARTDAAPVSPLAARIEAAADRPPPARPTTRTRPAPGRVAQRVAEPEPAPPPPPPPPPEPAWIGALRPAARAEARRLIERLEAADVAGADEVARAAVVDGEPAVVRVALRRAIAAAVAAGGDPAAVAARVVGLLIDGEDAALEVHWRLVDGDGRPVGRLDPGA